MILKQYYLGCLAHASYLVADEESGVAAVVDPQRDIDQYVRDAEDAGVAIRWVFLTHFHADFVAGHLELRDRVGARIALGSCAEAEYDFTPFADGEELELGPNVVLRVLHTPGHSPESITILVTDRERDAAKPYAALTGDTLFIGDVGRPDLRAALGWKADDLAELLYDSLHAKLLPLPDDTLVYPAHGAGSLCGKNISTDTVSTMGVQRLYNHALRPMAKDEFVRMVTADQPDAPSYFTYDAILNTKERPLLEEALERELTPLSLGRVLELVEAGAQLLDVREPAEYAGAHVVGAVNIPLGGSYATWAGTLLDRDRPIAIVAEPGREEEAAMRLGRIGLDLVSGYLAGGMLALEERPELVRQTERVTAPTLAERLGGPEPPLVLDVRTAREYEAGHIEGSVNVPLNRLPERLGELPRDRELAVTCASGYRSSVAMSLLEGAGFTRTVDLVGGTAAWQASQLATV
jgi:glyoxylase-like metal-dependent hydrolase (beta-lactamase superfamily II)/rhodanese-related sulfurtransferase